MRLAGVGAAGVTAGLALIRLGLMGPIPAATPEALVPLLIASALLCVVGLTRVAHPTAAWLSIVGATAVVTIDLATYAASARAVVGDPAWPLLVAAVCLCAFLSTASASAYAIGRPRLPRRWIQLSALAGLAVVASASVIAIATASSSLPAVVADSPLGNVRLVTRSLLVVVPLLTLVGLIGDAIPPAERATRRSALAQKRGSSPGDRVVAWLRAFADEVGPGRSRIRHAVLEERSRLARDIHADVMPALRVAVSAADRGVPQESVSAALREVLAELEDLGASRHPIQLEIGGLVPALEWLAERVEARSDVRVTLNVAESSGAADTTPPPDVAASAFRVAGLALDNVVRHAPGSCVEISVRAHAHAVEMALSDDGPGIASGVLTAAISSGRRGVADMVSEAAGCGAEVELGPGVGGHGTRVRFHWSAVAAS